MAGEGVTNQQGGRCGGGRGPMSAGRYPCQLIAQVSTRRCLRPGATSLFTRDTGLRAISGREKNGGCVSLTESGREVLAVGNPCSSGLMLLRFGRLSSVKEEECFRKLDEIMTVLKQIYDDNNNDNADHSNSNYNPDAYNNNSSNNNNSDNDNNDKATTSAARVPPAAARVSRPATPVLQQSERRPEPGRAGGGSRQLLAVGEGEGTTIGHEDHAQLPPAMVTERTCPFSFGQAVIVIRGCDGEGKVRYKPGVTGY